MTQVRAPSRSENPDGRADGLGGTVVLCNDTPGLLATLGTGYFRRAGVRVVTASSAEDLVRQAGRLVPRVVIVVAGLVDPRGERRIARSIRACAPEAVLLLALPRERVDMPEDLTLYDGMVALADPELDLARALSAVLPTPARREPRIVVPIPAVIFTDDDERVEAVALDISSAGAGLLVSQVPETRGPVRVVFMRGDGRRVSLLAEPVWADTGGDHSMRIGVRFVDATLDEIRALYDLAFWRVVEQSGTRVIFLHGEIGEATSFSGLLARVPEIPTLDFAAVTGATSGGLLRFGDFLRSLPDGLRVGLRRVPARLAEPLRRVGTVEPRCVVESRAVPYECDRCYAGIVAIEQAGETSRPPFCHECGRHMVVPS